jgi:transposase
MILKVRSGQMTASAAAAALGVSRKTYYQWEARGLAAMLQELEEKEPGRPPTGPSPEETALKAKVADLEKQVESLAETAELRALLRVMEANQAKKKANYQPNPRHDPLHPRSNRRHGQAGEPGRRT